MISPSGQVLNSQVVGPRWKVIAGRVTGPSHAHSGTPCQDAFSTQVIGGEILVAAVCDGAGSARYAEIGSHTASRVVVTYLARALEKSDAIPLDPQLLVEAAISSARAALEAEAAKMTEPARLQDFHATLIGCLADRTSGWFFHVGDGAACAAPRAADGSGPLWSEAFVSPPANGEHANETFFITSDDWRGNLRLTQFVGAEAIAIMSDGVTPFGMTGGCSAPEERFLAPVDRFLLEHDPDTATRALMDTLGDDRARKLSGDDKTLVWARLID